MCLPHKLKPSKASGVLHMSPRDATRGSINHITYSPADVWVQRAWIHISASNQHLPPLLTSPLTMPWCVHVYTGKHTHMDSVCIWVYVCVALQPTWDFTSGLESQCAAVKAVTQLTTVTSPGGQTSCFSEEQKEEERRPTSVWRGTKRRPCAFPWWTPPHTVHFACATFAGISHN